MFRPVLEISVFVFVLFYLFDKISFVKQEVKNAVAILGICVLILLAFIPGLRPGP